jgi:predicted nucleic acid-binding protein
LIDTSVAVELDEVGQEIVSGEIAVSTLTLGELEAGLRAAVDDLRKARRRRHLRDVERQTRALAFDRDCARAFGRVYAAVERAGRKPRGPRVVDLMIAATALAHDLPIYTRNAKDLRGLEGLVEMVEVDV